MALSKKRSPMLDYTTKLMLLELVKITATQDAFAAIWIQKNLTALHQRWEQLDGKQR